MSVILVTHTPWYDVNYIRLSLSFNRLSNRLCSMEKVTVATALERCETECSNDKYGEGMEVK